ncbi:MAG: HigA family addiction module antitoxin [Rhizobiaceae bacterium]
MTMTSGPVVHPGEILREEYLIPLNMSAGALARKLNVPRTRIERISTEKIGITADTAYRLAKFFRTTPQFWMNLQVAYDLAVSADEMTTTLSKIDEIESA